MRQDEGEHGGNETNDARAPLIGNSSERSDNDNEQQPTPAKNVSIFNTSPIITFLTLSAGISGLLFGYDTGVISSTLVSIDSDLSNRPLTTADKSLITAITSLLALIFAPSTGYFADRYGRRSVIFFPALLFVAGAVIQAVATEVWIMVAGRGLVGAAVGVASGAVPLYITELAPAEMRGRLVTVQSLFITGGQVVAYLVGWLSASWPHGWRWMVGIGAVPALLQLMLLTSMPETPRWLVQRGKVEKARSVLMNIYTGLPEDQGNEAVNAVLESVQSEITAENKIHDSDTGAILKELITLPSNRRALTIACMLQGLQQLCGFNSLMYFSATIFLLSGFTSPILTSLSIALTNFLFTLLAFSVIDTLGRRKILLYSIPFMVLGLGTCSVAFQFLPIGNGDAPFPTSTGQWSVILLLALIVYVATYALGLGCVPWQQSELFPLRVRSLGSGLATTTNWSSNFLIGITFLPMLESFGATWTFALYALICFAGWWLVWGVYPETAGLELEDIGGLFESSWGVRESVEGFKARKRGTR